MEYLTVVAGLVASLGILLTLAGLIAARRFARRSPSAPREDPPDLTPITLMKPLCGPEPDLEEALASFCRQDHPRFQIVFGLRHQDDPAMAVVRRLRARFAAVDIALVVDPTPHGMNLKVANLLNMMPHARHDVLVFADSDLHVAPDYLRRIQAALAAPSVGLVTTVYVGRPAVRGFAARLGASHLSHTFLPGALLSRLMGRQDCLGSTMALTRETLRRAGGLQALSPHLADDNVLGQRVRALGLSVVLADTVPVTAVQERTARELWTHELRWARTIGALEPLAYAASALQYPIAWALVAALLAGFQPWSLLLLAASVAVRAAAARGIDRALAPLIGEQMPRISAWLLPLRDVLSLAEVIASYRGHHVVWRGHAMRADDGRGARSHRRGALWRGIRTRTAGGILLGLLGAGAALAQQPSPAQLDAIKQSCRADYQAHCGSVPPGGSAALACLKDNAPSLSGACQAAVGAVGGAAPKPSQSSAGKPAPLAKPAGPPLSPRQELAALRHACGADYRLYCRGVRPGGGAAIACLRDNGERLSPPCQQTLMSLRH